MPRSLVIASHTIRLNPCLNASLFSHLFLISPIFIQESRFTAVINNQNKCKGDVILATLG